MVVLCPSNKGIYEALELRDGGSDYLGKCVLKERYKVRVIERDLNEPDRIVSGELLQPSGDTLRCSSWVSKMSGKGKGLAIGIDLGTAYSRVGVWKHDRVNIIPNNLTPSYIGFTDTDKLIGDAAKNQVAVNTTNIVFGSGKKCTMGTNYDARCTNMIILKASQTIFRHVEEAKGKTKYLSKVSFIEVV